MKYNCQAATRSLYIHWPFCPYKCHFCPFVAIASQDQFMTQYHTALMQEVRTYAQACDQKQQLDTIFFGGGTPSTYPDDLLLDTFATLRKEFAFSDAMEISIEVNPGTVRPGQLQLWKDAGINRLSIGVQSLNDEVLKKLNRHQSAQDVYNLIDATQDIFDNVSVDIILGLPGVTPEEWKQLIHTIGSWPVKHVSLYFLTIHENTQLYFGIQSKKVVLPADDEMIDLYYWSIDALKEHGFEQYEISSFARPGYRAKHNTVYWDRKPYKGFGIGACSFDGEHRLQNEKNLMKYMAGVARGEDMTIFEETLTQEQVYLEKVMLGLRRSCGMKQSDILAAVLPEKQQLVINKIDMFKEQGFLVEKNGCLVLTPAGLAVENEIVVQLSL